MLRLVSSVDLGGRGSFISTSEAGEVGRGGERRLRRVACCDHQLISPQVCRSYFLVCGCFTLRKQR